MEPEARAYAYDNDFFAYIEEGARRSAQAIVPLMRNLLGVRSVLDVGCGRGVWLREWREAGTADAVGVDGNYVDRSRLAIPADQFVERDLSQPFSLERRFDLVQSLEVGEHIAEQRADTFVANLVTHGDVILFSAAVPGQGGEFHVNEQPYGYWRDKFAMHDFRTFDWLRPRICDLTAIEPWYRYNTLLFARGAALDAATTDLLQTEIPRDQPIPIRAPLSWRIRNGVLSQLPRGSVHLLAILKHRLVLMRRARNIPRKQLRSALRSEVGRGAAASE
jgi:SAM-dependent methyltransferase